jgi:hypothetical protein
MIWSRSKSVTKRASWLAIVAVLLQAILPALHDASAMAGSQGFDAAHNLCLAPGSTVPGNPDKAPHHHLPACALCSAMHLVGGFVPPQSPAMPIRRHYGVVTPPASLVFAARPWLRVRHQPRAPPILA